MKYIAGRLSLAKPDPTKLADWQIAEEYEKNMRTDSYRL
jgi:hypothetical protein